jgi:hypothetical protein
LLKHFSICLVAGTHVGKPLLARAPPCRLLFCSLPTELLNPL